MAVKTRKSSGLTVTAVRNAKPGTDADGKPVKRVLVDGKGLMLVIAATGAKNWVLRAQVDGKRRDIGLGACDVDGAGRDAFQTKPDASGDREGETVIDDLPVMMKKFLTLAEAREKAAALRKIGKAGGDPIAERDRERRHHVTFAAAATEAHKALSPTWSDRTGESFLAAIERYANPVLGKMRVDDVAAKDIVAALAPIWSAKPDLGRKQRQRISTVLSYAKAQGWRTNAVPTAAELSHGLGKQPVGRNYAAMPFAEVQAFFDHLLAKEQSPARLALAFVILTGCRQGEARKTTWAHFDLEARKWTRPPELMLKGKHGGTKSHVVALSVAAVAILERAKGLWRPKDCNLVFPSAHSGKALSDMGVLKAMRDADQPVYVPHGFRSSFKTWATERDRASFDIVEMSLAHEVGGQVERKYNRADLFDLRLELMERWGRFVAPALSGAAGNVVALRAGGAA